MEYSEVAYRAANVDRMAVTGTLAVIAHGPALAVVDLAGDGPARVTGTGIAHVEAITTAVLDGGPVAVCADRARLHAFDLPSGARRELELPETSTRRLASAVVDGRPVLIGAEGPDLLVWDLATGALIRPLRGGASRVAALATSPDVPVAVAVHGDGTLRLWDLETGSAMNDPAAPADGEPGNGPHVVVAGALAVTATTDGRLLRHALTTGEPIGAPFGTPHHSVQALGTATIDDRICVVVASGHQLTVWDPATGEPAAEPLTDHRHQVIDVAGVRIGDTSALVSAAMDDTVRVWGAHVPRPAVTRTVAITAVAISGTTVVSGDEDGVLRRRDLATLAPIGEPVRAHGSRIRALATTEAGGRPAAVSAAGRELRVWDLADGEPLTGPVDTRYGTRFLGVAHHDGVPIAVSLHSDGRTRVWNLGTGEPVTGAMDDWANARVFTELDGVLYAVTEDHPFEEEYDDYDFEEIALQAWDFAEGEKIGGELAGGGFGVTVTEPPVTVAHVDGEPAVISGCGADGRLRAWRLGSGTPLCAPMDGGGAELTALAVTVHEGRTLAVTGDVTGVLRVWDVAAGDPVGGPLRGHFGRITGVAAAGSRAVSVSGDGTLRGWNLITGEVTEAP